MGALTRRRPPAFSLAELALSCALLGVVIAVLGQTFGAGIRLWNLDQSRSEAQLKGMLAHQRMEQELTASVFSSLYVLDEPGLTAFSFLAVDQAGGFDPATGLPIWRAIIAYYLRGGSLFRTSWKPGQPPALACALPSTQPFALTADQLRQLCNGAPGQRVCDSVVFLGLIRATPGPYQLRLDVQTLTPKGLETFPRQSDLCLRNGQNP